jgi:hypothetical protein
MVPNSRNKSVPNTVDQLVDDFQTSVLWDALDDERCMYVIADACANMYPSLFRSCKGDEVECSTVGKVSCIQERGCKARWIAMPRLIFQVASLSLGEYLQDVIAATPWDCTRNQDSGPEWAQAELRKGRKLFSVDLSSFTDMFPLELILRVLRWTNAPDEYLHFFEWLSTGTWHVPGHLRLGLTEIQWKRGQPLGCIASFPAAALAHGALLRSIEMTYNLNDTFRVLGDDVIISNPLTHWAYRNWLDKLGCPVSEPKTITGEIGEFAGRVITRKRIMLPSKVTIPTRDNLLFRLGQELTLEEARTPLGLLAALMYEVPLRSDMPLQKRVMCRYNLSPPKEVVDMIYKTFGERLANRISYKIFEKCYKSTTIESRASEVRSFKESLSLLIDDFAQLCSMSWDLYSSSDESQDPLYYKIAKLFGIEIGVAPPEISIPLSIQHEMTVSSFADVFANKVRSLSPRSTQELINRLYKRQVEIARKSSSIVEYEILEEMLIVLQA